MTFFVGGESVFTSAARNDVGSEQMTDNQDTYSGGGFMCEARAASLNGFGMAPAFFQLDAGNPNTHFQILTQCKRTAARIRIKST